MFKVDLDGMRRADAFVQLEDGEQDSGLLMRSLRSFFSNACNLPARFFFTTHGRLFYQRPYSSNETQLLLPGGMNIYRAGGCEPCPEGLVSDGAVATSVQSCICPPGQFLNLSAGIITCQDIRSSCGPDEYVTRDATSTSNKQCARCKPCPPGFFRVYGICDGNQRVDPVDSMGVEDACRPCSSCPAGKYLAPDACDGTGGSNVVGDAQACLDCRLCPDMHVVQNMCPGNTRFDTQNCTRCVSHCPFGTYVRLDVCPGYTFSESSSIVVAEDHCIPCPSCEPGAIRTGLGCTGKDHNMDVACVTCESSCEAGQYVSEMCSAGGNPFATCAYCDQQCPRDTYFKAPCSGHVFGMQDVDCGFCAPCAEGQYISKRCPGNNVIRQDTRECSNCTASCGLGNYMATRCDGTSFSDVVQCLPCRQQCPSGQYIRGQCSGILDVNDCVPCTPCAAGQYMSSGPCSNGTAKSPGQRSCSSCRTCPVGKYVVAGTACDGRGASNSVECRQCSPCPRGFFVVRPCNNTGSSPEPQQCAPCRTCPAGFYRTGCLGDTAYDNVQCIACPNCSQGQYIAGRCTGAEFSPSEQACVDCAPCALGQYYASGCTGREATGDRVCAACRQLCPVGKYVAQGCRGDALSFADRPSICGNCSRSCTGVNQYVVAPCDGTTFQSGPPNCATCTCPDAYKPIVEYCTSIHGLQDQKCSRGWVGPDRRPSSNAGASGTTEQQQQQRWTTTTAAASITTTPPPSSASSGGGSLSVEVIAGIVLGGIAAVGLSLAYFFCAPAAAAAAAL